MDRWINKVAVVTGASAGIGAAICKDLVRAGMIVVGLARRKERIEALRADIPSNATGKLYAFTCDVAKDDDIERAFAWIESELGAVHVLINNAGIVRMGTITGEGSCEKDLQDTLRTNVWGTVQCTRKAVEIMKRKKIIGAHVILINSIVGHKVVQPLGGPGAHPTFNVYPVSKFGITALGQVLQQEFNADGLQYKLTVSTLFNH